MRDAQRYVWNWYQGRRATDATQRQELASKIWGEKKPLRGGAVGWLGQAGSECRQKIHRYFDRFDVGLVSGDDLLFHRLAHWDQLLT